MSPIFVHSQLNTVMENAPLLWYMDRLREGDGGQFLTQQFAELHRRAAALDADFSKMLAGDDDALRDYSLHAKPCAEYIRQLRPVVSGTETLNPDRDGFAMGILEATVVGLEQDLESLRAKQDP